MNRGIKLAVLLLVAATSTKAQWTDDVAVNTTVRGVSAGEAAVPLTTEGPDGSTYISWFENESGAYQLRMQRLDANGYPLWPSTGLLVSDHPQGTAVFRYDLQSDDEDNAIVAFQDERTGTLDVVAYKIAPDGTFLWGPDGVELPTPGTTGISPVVAALDNGHTAIAWNTNNSPGQLALQLLGPTGTLVLPVPLMISASSSVGRAGLVATEDGGFILQYVVNNGSFGLPPGTMYAQRYDATGNTIWPSAVQVSSKPIPFFFFPHLVPDEQDGYYVAFNSGNPSNPNMTDVYVQRVRGNGTVWSVEGTRCDDGNNTQKFTAGKGLALVDEDAGLMVPLQVTDGAQGQSGVAVQRLDTAGVRQLGDGAVVIIPISAQSDAPNDISATDDGAVIIHNAGTFGQVHLSATRVDLNGATLWNPAQQPVSTASSNKDDVQLTEEEDGLIVTVWQDDRNPVGIYAQAIDSSDFTTSLVELPTSSQLVRLEQNPSHMPVLLLPTTFKGMARIQVFDAQGKVAYSTLTPARVRVPLPLDGLDQGMYTIQVTGDGHTEAVRWVK